MSNYRSDFNNTTERVADDTQALLAATADIVEDKVVQARNRLSAAIETAREKCALASKNAVESAKAADKAIRDKPYQAMGIAFAVGTLVGILLMRRSK
jgi:ElaB/YqjD/DUF883 family membrane-anchored ribosome-binding protein